VTQQQRQWIPDQIRPTARPDPTDQRFVCFDCGADVLCHVGLVTISGRCTVCGGAHVVRLREAGPGD
jgi:hypothetical protein